MTELDLILRAIVVWQVLLLAALVVAVRRDHTGFTGAACCLAVVAFVLTSTPDSSWLGLWVYPLTALCVSKAALFWMFARGLFADSFRLRRSDVALLALVAGYGLWQQLVFVERARSGVASLPEQLASFGFSVVVLAFVLLALFEAWHGLAADLVERRRRSRLLFVAVVAAWLASAVLVQGYNLVLQAQTPPLWAAANFAAVAVLAAAAGFTLLRPRTTNWLSPAPRASGGLDAADSKLLAKLQHALETDRVYHDEGLTIGRLAEQLGTGERDLRRVINHGLGFRNFNDFLHAYRIREVCDRLRQADGARRPVLSLALEAGYRSIGPFNRAFKARTGMTPTSFRRAAPKGGQPAV
jgi:AraC-like DNA-binding protein